MGISGINDGWFIEMSDQSFAGQARALKVKSFLHHGRSKFQEVLVFESESYGNVLVLDGIIQATERDEFAYQEMISHIPLYAHLNPSKVLVIGGGDGGVLREVVKHNSVNSVTLVEIDETVITLAKKYLPSMSSAFNHPKVDVKLQDGFMYLRAAAAAHQKFDIIITDSSDPEGPAAAFFQKEYFQLLFNALNGTGIVIAQTSENVWLNLQYIKQLMTTAREVFPVVNYCYTTVPTYTSGQLGLIVCGKKQGTNLVQPIRQPSETEQENMRYYNSQMHSASFILPTWAENCLNR
ncbi:LAMI_0H17546g1_1 [Lachancea mirantina]|uniref:LAMI_0H17546g1_1 n=1 Tax=Lachancea mirantina TaxID=1230905 RepID=A0A1G4KJ82_9SACH|nr:LAMI_0H17546g1_1 [Lachancea mirantina]